MNLTELLKNFIRLFLGFFIISFGIVLMYKAAIGMTPWGTFHVGLMEVTPLSLGRISQLVGLIIILFSFALKIYPGIGTILNMIFVGYFIDVINNFFQINNLNSLIMKCLLCLLGLWIFSYGIYLYISSGLGAGPRDGLMVGLMKITGISVTYIKPAIEFTVIVIGILLGGPFGLGTFIVALLGGKFLDIIFKLHNYDPTKSEHLSLKKFAQQIF